MSQALQTKSRRSQDDWIQLMTEYEAGELTQRQFHYPAQPGDKAALDWTQLKLLLEGIDVTTARHYKRYRHPQHARIAV